MGDIGMEDRTKLDQVRQTISFLASAVKCGAEWDDKCEEMLDKATTAIEEMEEHRDYNYDRPDWIGGSK
jgi:hypothetical protein